MIKKIIVCDICGKEEDFDSPYRKKWFIENIVNSICTEKCFYKKVKEKTRR